MKKWYEGLSRVEAYKVLEEKQANCIKLAQGGCDTLSEQYYKEFRSEFKELIYRLVDMKSFYFVNKKVFAELEEYHMDLLRLDHDLREELTKIYIRKEVTA